MRSGGDGLLDNRYTFDVCWARWRYWGIQKWLVICAIASTLGFNTGDEPDAHLVAAIYQGVSSAIDDYGSLPALREEAYRHLRRARNGASC